MVYSDMLKISLFSLTYLTQESINCLDVTINGRKIPFTRFLYELTQKSAEIVNKGGLSII